MKRRKGALIVSRSESFYGPSGATRTRGFHIPNVAPYQLGYTRISSEETRCITFPPYGENSISAPSFFLPELDPQSWAPIRKKREKKLAALRFRLTAKRPRSSELAYYTSSAGGTQGNFLPAGGASVFSLMFLYNCGILSKGV